MKNILMLIAFLSFILLLVCQPFDVYAQDTPLFRVVTNDGNSFIGTLVSENDNSIVLRTQELGDVTIQRTNIKSMEEIESDRLKNGEYWFENPHGTRYLFSTSAIGLRKGEGYYQNTWIFFNNVNYGFSNNISMGAGLIPSFLFGGGATPVWLLPKVSIPLAKDNLHLAAGGMFGGLVGDGESVGGGLAYGAITAGNTDKNITFAVGFGYAAGEWSDIPLFNINGMLRLNRTMYLITENYIVSAGGETAGFLMGGVRWAPENFAVDFALLRPYVVGENIGVDFIGVPWLSIAIPFGK